MNRSTSTRALKTLTATISKKELSFARSLRMVLLLFLVFLSPGILAAQNYFVDAENGNNMTGDGSFAAPWKTVYYALTQIAPDSDSTIELLGTSDPSFTYSPSYSDEEFPWNIRGDISLIASPLSTYFNFIVDVELSDPNLFVYDPAYSPDSAKITGLTFENGTTALSADFTSNTFALEIDDCKFIDFVTGIDGSASGAGTVFTPIISNCYFETIVYCFLLDGSAAAEFSPTIISNNSKDDCARFLIYDADGTDADGRIEDNVIETMRGTTLSFTGPTTGGELFIENNTIDYDGSDTAVYFSYFTSAVNFIGNSVSSYNAHPSLKISYCIPWHPESTIEQNTLGGYIGGGIWITHSSDVAIRNGNTVISKRTDPIHTEYSTGTIVDENILISEHYGVNLYTNAHGAQITRNTIGDTSMALTGGIFISGDNVLVKDNEISNGLFGITVGGGSGIEVVGNKIYDHDLQGIDVWAAGVKIHGNEIFANSGPGILDSQCEGSHYSSNMIYNNTGSGMELTATSTTTYPLIVHNTCADNGMYAFDTALDPATSVWVANNIFTGSGMSSDINGLDAGEYACNLIGSGGTSGLGNLLGNAPGFVSPGSPDWNYHILQTSDCVDAGTNLGKLRATDFDENPRILDSDWNKNVRTDIGADEYTDVALSVVSGTFKEESPLELDIAGPQGHDFFLYAAIDEHTLPLADQPGVENIRFGTIIVDPAKLVAANPIATGQAGTPVVLTVPKMAGWHVALQALVVNPANWSGQLTNVVTFEILEL